MNKINAFLVLSIVVATSLFAGIAMVTPALAKDNTTILLENSSLPLPLDRLRDMNMTMDNSTSMGGNLTIQ